MKAVVLTKYGALDELRIKDMERPSPQDGEVLVKVKAASVNDWDWVLVNGSPFYIRLICGLFRPKIQIPGTDVSGEVVGVGANVRKFQPGDNVYGDLSESGFGSFAEFVCIPENALALKPRNLSHQEAAAIPHAAMLALQGLRDLGNIKAGQTLLINGAGGGVGTIGVQLAKSMGVGEVAGVDSAIKLDMLSEVGFDHTIDYQQDDFTAGNRQYDLILDPKTNRSPFRYLKVLKPGGTYVTVGGLTSKLLQALFLAPLVRLVTKKNILILGLKPNKGMSYMNELLEAGKVKPVIDGPYELSNVVDALKLFGEGKHQGKVVITINEERAAT